MALPLEINSATGELTDTLVRAASTDWIQTHEKAFMKVLYTASERGSWAMLLRWLKGYSAVPHKYSSGSHTFS